MAKRTTSEIDPARWRANPARDPLMREVLGRPPTMMTPDARARSEIRTRKTVAAAGTVEAAASFFPYWDIPANGWGQLVWSPGSPLVARGISFRVTPIAWRAGQGWPVYSTTTPQSDLYLGSMRWPQLSVHSIWMASPGYRPYELAPNVPDWSGVLTANGPVTWYTGVNDDQYADNTGGYRFTLYSWW
jgi:hypothetical protein